MSGTYHLVHGTVIAVFGQLDTAATEAGGGYDKTYREPNLERANASDMIGAVAREETEYKVRVQVEDRLSGGLAQLMTGQQRERALELTADWRELLDESLVDANGDPMVRKGARLKRVEDRDGEVVSSFPNADGMYVDRWTKEPTIGAPRSITWTLTPRRKGV